MPAGTRRVFAIPSSRSPTAMFSIWAHGACATSDGIFHCSRCSCRRLRHRTRRGRSASGGRLVDRRGTRSARPPVASVAMIQLLAVAALPASASPAVLVALAIGIGLATPPVGSCLRRQLPTLLPDSGAARSAWALEASVAELTYILGPPLALCIGGLWVTGAALAVGGVVLLAATAAFAAATKHHLARGRRRPNDDRIEHRWARQPCRP